MIPKIVTAILDDLTDCESWNFNTLHTFKYDFSAMGDCILHMKELPSQTSSAEISVGVLAKLCYGDFYKLFLVRTVFVLISGFMPEEMVSIAYTCEGRRAGGWLQGEFRWRDEAKTR